MGPLDTSGVRDLVAHCAFAGVHAQLQIPIDDEPRFVVEYLTIAESARRVRCCERTIRRAIAAGELRAGRVRGDRGNRGGWRIRAAAWRGRR